MLLTRDIVVRSYNNVQTDIALLGRRSGDVFSICYDALQPYVVS